MKELDLQLGPTKEYKLVISL